METEAAKLIWKRSVSRHKTRHTSILYDGDNKTVSALNEIKPYGDENVIKKWNASTMCTKDKEQFLEIC